MIMQMLKLQSHAQHDKTRYDYMILNEFNFLKAFKCDFSHIRAATLCCCTWETILQITVMKFYIAYVNLIRFLVTKNVRGSPAPQRQIRAFCGQQLLLEKEGNSFDSDEKQNNKPNQLESVHTPNIWEASIELSGYMQQSC